MDASGASLGLDGHGGVCHGGVSSRHHSRAGRARGGLDLAVGDLRDNRGARRSLDLSGRMSVKVEDLRKARRYGPVRDLAHGRSDRRGRLDLAVGDLRNGRDGTGGLNLLS